MNRAVLLAIAAATCALPALADERPGDVQAYIDRHAACNYWPNETAPRHSLRAAEIERHTRNLHCDTLVRDFAVLEARYRDKPELIEAMRDAEYAVPE